MPSDDAANPPTDALSAVGRKLLKLDLEKVYVDLVVNGSGNPTAQGILESISSRDLLEGPIARSDEANALMAGLWLRFDWLDQSHTISQGIESPTGSWWHAIMHRREGDFSNSKYWYRRVNSHPAAAPLSARLNELINAFPADTSIFKINAHGWNPMAFVDLVQQVYEKPSDPRHRLAVAIQEIEWQVLFDHCTRAAGGK